jgi:uncharacterized OB-fold protein
MFENYYINKVSVKCSICGKSVKGIEIPWKRYHGNIDVVSKYLIGIHCQNCGAAFCGTKHKKELQYKLRDEYERSICPKCKEPLNSGSAILESKVFGKIKKFFPKQMKDLLNEAMNTKEDSAYQEDVLNSKADNKKKFFRFFKTKNWRENLEKVVRKFYSTLCIKRETNDRRTYQSLAPNVMSRVDEEKFKQIWDAFNQKMEDEIKKQEHVVCAQCGKEYDGIWAVDRYIFTNKILKSNVLLLVRCPQCGSVYCSSCYIGLKNRHTCPNCGKKMEHRGEFLETFLSHQLLMIRKAILSNVTIEKKTDRLADILYDVTFEYSYYTPATTLHVPIEADLDLGERGKITLLFFNNAVKIGKEWRIVSPYPGTLYED